MATREELQQLVSSLPEGALDNAKQALEHLQTWPPPVPPAIEAFMGRDQAFARAQERMKEVRQRMMDRREAAGDKGCFVSSAGWGGTVRGGKRYGRHSFGYEDEEGKAYETTILQADRELRLTERLRLDEDAGTMKMKIVLLGPDQTTATFEHTFRLPPPETGVPH